MNGNRIPGGHRDHPYTPGQCYLVRTVTMYTLGKLCAVYEGELVFTHASWVASTGEWAEALQNGKLAQIEPVPGGGDVIVSRGAIVDVVKWNHPLPTKKS